MAKVIRHGSRLMYTSHPNHNRIISVTPDQLAEASRRVHRIQYASLIGVHRTIREIAQVVAELNPDLVLFFATGGIPIVFPLMHVLSAQGHLGLTNGDVFHMLPGLAWDGEIEGCRPTAYFQRGVAPLLRIVRQNHVPRILAIDTTNSGNAVNLAVRAIEAACNDDGLANAQVFVIGVVNGARVAGANDGNRLPLHLSDGTDAHVLTPGGYTSEDALVQGQFVRFRVDNQAQPNHIQLSIGYWVVDDLFTEDNAELVGIAAAHGRLAVLTTGALTVNALLNSIQIYWLATQQALSVQATPRVLAALRDAQAGRSDNDDQTIVEAARFFRRAFPGANGEASLEQLAQLRDWWIAEVNRLWA